MLSPRIVGPIQHRRLNRICRLRHLARHLLLDALRLLARHTARTLRRIRCVGRLIRRLIRCLVSRILGHLRRGRGYLCEALRTVHDDVFCCAARGRGVGVDLEFAFLADELGDVSDAAVARVFDRGVFGAGGEELDGGEARDLVRDVVGGGVDFGDGDRVVDVEGGELFVFRCKPVELS